MGYNTLSAPRATGVEMGWAFFALAASAAPRFLADVPRDAVVAAAAWEAAAACTGWEAPAAAEVPIYRRPIRGGWLGQAHQGPRGLAWIELAETDPARVDEVLVHEVAHAWVQGGPPTLTEGRNELLADCIVRLQPGLAPHQWDDGRDLTAMPDLVHWDNSDDHGPNAQAAQRTDAYLGAARLLRTVATVLDERLLWTPEGLSWDQFRALLASAGTDGALILALLDGGPALQQAGLADGDRDGQPIIAEVLRGTDPDRWDSDGDGWWDGAQELPEGAVAVPLDGSLVCLGSEAGPAGARVLLVSGGELRGGLRPRVELLGHSPGTWQQVRAGQPLLVRLAPTGGTPGGGLQTGGVWARPLSSELAPTSACATTQEATVFTTRPEHEDWVAPLLQAVAAHSRRAEARWGPAPGRVVVQIGGRTSTQEAGRVILSDAELDPDPSPGRIDQLARLAVAVHRLWATGQPEWPAAVAMARNLAAP